MHINAILSSMGAWDQLVADREALLGELTQALSTLKWSSKSCPSPEIIGRWHRNLNHALDQQGWAIGTQISLLGGKRTFYTLDFLKQKVGGKLILGKQAFVLSSLLAHFPLSIQIQELELGVLILPMKSLKADLPRGIADYEGTTKILEELSPLLIRYPYLIMGFSPTKTPLEVTELTSDLDQFLLAQLGYTLNEMLMLGEKPAYDFKLQLPEKIEQITKEVCALANLEGGGCLLFGIRDDGSLEGMPSSELDTAKLRITNSVRSLLDPIPPFRFSTFESPEDPDRIILICQVEELQRKPCLLHHRAYVRSGPSAQPADAEEMRALVLGGS